MCDMTQFIVVVLVPNETAAILTEHLMKNVLLEFEIFHFVILNDGSPFTGVFSEMCKTLNVNYNILAKRNSKGLLVEKFHRFINKTIIILAEDRDTNNTFVAASVTANTKDGIVP